MRTKERSKLIASKCRICLLKLENGCSKDIFKTTFNKELLSVVITKLANVEVLESDSLPHSICPDCWEKLQDSYSFRALIIKSDIELRGKPDLTVLEQRDARDKIASPTTSVADNSIELDCKKISEGLGTTACSNIDEPSKWIKKSRVHACQECGKVFPRALELRRHSKSHPGRNQKPDVETLEQEDAGEELTSDTILITENRTEVDCKQDNGGLEMIACKNAGPSRPTRKRQAHACQECGEVFPRAVELRRHNRSHTGQNKKSVGKVSEQEDARERIPSHTISIAQNRIEVDRQQDNKDSPIPVHKNGGTPKSIKKRRAHACQECGKVFPRGVELRRHNRSHTGEKPFRCDLCGQGFPFRWNLEVHKQKHSDDFGYSCETCGKGFKYHSSLIIHRKIHLGERNHKCDICNKTFVQKAGLNAHKRNTHTDGANFICEYCSKALKSKDGLTLHIKMIHFKQIKMEDCPICGKTFAHKYLRKHIEKHSGEKSFECSICKDKFSEKGSVRNHIRRVHEGRKPFECEVCGKKFPIKYECNMHMRVHTKERPFPCWLCEKTFAYKHHLRNHLSKEHLNENVASVPMDSVMPEDEHKIV